MGCGASSTPRYINDSDVDIESLSTRARSYAAPEDVPTTVRRRSEHWTPLSTPGVTRPPSPLAKSLRSVAGIDDDLVAMPGWSEADPNSPKHGCHFDDLPGAVTDADTPLRDLCAVTQSMEYVACGAGDMSASIVHPIDPVEKDSIEDGECPKV